MATSQVGGLPLFNNTEATEVAESTATGIPLLTSGVVSVSNVTNDAQIKAADFPGTTVDSEVALYSGTTGKVLKRSSGTGRAFLTAGVLSAMDPASTMFLDDDFMSATTTTTNFSTLGWTVANGSQAFVAGVANHPGILQKTTGATAAVAYLALRGTPATGLFLPAELFDMTWIVRLNTNDANTVIRMGLTSDPSSSAPTHGIYVEKKAADTQWFGTCRATNSENRTAALATIDTNFHRFRIWRSDASTISFSIDGGTALTQTSTIPTAALMVGLTITNNSAAEDKTIDLDYFSLRITGMSR